MNTFKFFPTLLHKDLWRDFSLRKLGNLNKITLNGRAKESDRDAHKQTKTTPLLLLDLSLFVSHHQIGVTPFSSASSELYFSQPFPSPPVLFTTTPAWQSQQQTTGRQKQYIC